MQINSVNSVCSRLTVADDDSTGLGVLSMRIRRLCASVVHYAWKLKYRSWTLGGFRALCVSGKHCLSLTHVGCTRNGSHCSHVGLRAQQINHIVGVTYMKAHERA